MIRLSDGTMHAIGKPFTPCIETIAQSLAFTNRYNGSIGTYSVAQHCVLVARQLPPELRLAGLLHDAPETYLGDMPAPLKAYCPDYCNLEAFYHNVIDEYFGIDTQSTAVHAADMRVFSAESVCFGLGIECAHPWGTADLLITPWPPERAKAEFLEEFDKCLTR